MSPHSILREAVMAALADSDDPDMTVLAARIGRSTSGGIVEITAMTPGPVAKHETTVTLLFRSGRRPQGEQPPAARGEPREPASEDRPSGREGGQKR